VDAFARRAFGPFDFSDIQPRLPTESFQSRHELVLEGRRVELPAASPPELFARMARWSSRHGA
jgi:hypothetical protein